MLKQFFALFAFTSSICAASELGQETKFFVDENSPNFSVMMSEEPDPVSFGLMFTMSIEDLGGKTSTGIQINSLSYRLWDHNTNQALSNWQDSGMNGVFMPGTQIFKIELRDAAALQTMRSLRSAVVLFSLNRADLTVTHHIKLYEHCEYYREKFWNITTNKRGCR